MEDSSDLRELMENIKQTNNCIQSSIGSFKTLEKHYEKSIQLLTNLKEILDEDKSSEDDESI